MPHDPIGGYPGRERLEVMDALLPLKQRANAMLSARSGAAGVSLSSGILTD